MAGIGFELRRLSRQDNLLGPLVALSHASVVAAGPWLFTIFSLLTVTKLAGFGISESDINIFRITIIYGFCVSLVATAPITIVATRVLADHLYERRIESVRALLVSTLALAMPIAAVASVLVFAAFVGPASSLTVAATVTVALVAGIWCVLLFCSAVRDYTGITAGFAAGLLVSLAGTVVAGRNGGGGVAMTLAFAAGLAVVLFWLLGRLYVTFPASPSRLVQTALRDHLAAMRKNAVLAIGGLAAVVAVWIDKWIIWASDFGSEIDGRLVHAPVYDTPTFVAYLTVIPSLALFVVALETKFFETIRRFMRSISQHATLAEIRRGQRVVERSTIRSLSQLVLLQATLCGLVMLLAPVVIEFLGMQFRQISVLRFAALATVFHLLFLVCSSLLLFFARHRLFAALQFLFLVLQAVLTYATVLADERFLGLGYLGASVISAIASFVALERTMHNLGYVIFAEAASSSRPSDEPWFEARKRVVMERP